MLDELSRKFDRTKRAAGSYVHDQVEQTCAIAVSYAIVAGLYSAAAIFSIAALLVGATAGFRWVELNYGLFEAFGALAAFLVVTALICAILAIYRLNPPAKPIVPLATRLRAAVTAAPSADAQCIRHVGCCRRVFSDWLGAHAPVEFPTLGLGRNVGRAGYARWIWAASESHQD
jgi:hypothetical protein